MDHKQLVEMATDIENNGFADIRDGAISKIAESSELLRALNEEIKAKSAKKDPKKGKKKTSKKKSGNELISGMFAFKKEASKAKIAKNAFRKSARMGIFDNKLIDGLAQTALVGLGISVAGRAIDNAEKSWDKKSFNRKKKKLIAFARSENPGLGDVSDKRLGRFLDSAYSISPRVAKDPLSASAYINTAHAVGGVDLGTMKTLSDIQSKGGQGYTGNYDAISSVSSDIKSQLKGY